MGGIALLECCLPEEVNVTLPAFDLLEVEFFDGECVVIVYRLRTVGSKSKYYIWIPADRVCHQQIRHSLQH